MSHAVTFNEHEFQPAELAHYQLIDNCLQCEDSNGLLLRVEAISHTILRFRFAIEEGFPDDFSYAIDSQATFETGQISVKETADSLILSTTELHCEIAKTGFTSTIRNNQGEIICADEKGFHWQRNHEQGGNIVLMSKYASEEEAFYGLGDKPTELNLRNKRFKNWGMDEYGFNKNTDPLYKSIPVYYSLQGEHAYALFFDNSYEAHFDFAMERSNIVSFWAHGGEMNYYFVYGPQLMSACKDYTKLTGTPDLPPLWALGYQQCKWSYYPESEVKQITNTFRDLKIPCDAIYLDIDYMDEFRCFTWDNEKFPDPKRMVEELKQQGFKTMVIIDPGIKKEKGYSVFDEGLAKGYFCKHADGHYYQGKVWPGECYFPDFTNPEVRDWWAGLYHDLIENIGIAGVWNDMNEPAIFEVPSKTFNLDVMHNYDGHPASHRKAHNIYGMQMARATAAGVKKHSQGQRSLIITRSGYSGLQRYSSVWTGDNIASWEHLWLASVQAQRLAISGISFSGSDIGGFIGQPTPELMIRWIQSGIFHPFCRVHSSGDHGDQEPWVFGDQCTDIFRQFVELRYRLLPYLYTAFYQYHKEATPMLRPLIFADQTDAELINHDSQFLCGDHILVCPVLEPMLNTKPASENVTEATEQLQELYLPAGQWYDFWTGNAFSSNSSSNSLSEGTQLSVPMVLEQMPIFIKAGAVLPTFPVQQYVGEKDIQTLFLSCYFVEGESESFWYDDDNNSYQYQQGQYALAHFKVNGSPQSIQIDQQRQGDYQSTIQFYQLSLIGCPFQVNHILVDGQVVEADQQGAIQLNSQFNQLIIS